MASSNRKWFGDRLWYLLNLRPDELREIFPDQTWDNMKNKRKIWNKRIKDGQEPAPRRPEDYHLGDTPKVIRERLAVLDDLTREDVGQSVEDAEALAALHEELDKAYKKHKIDARMVSRVDISNGGHTGYIKNVDGEIEYTKKLKNNKIILRLEPRKFEPDWVTVGPPVGNLKPLKAIKRNRDPEDKVCLVLPDPQIGYRMFGDGSKDPFHDNKAISIALQVLADVKPEKVVFLGDYLDLPMFGTYEQSEEYAHTAQLAVNYGYRLLAKIRATVPDAEIVVIEGNHDRRIEKALQRNTIAAYGLRQADVDGMREFPSFSVPHLLRFNELGVKYVEGYPAGRYWINERLQCIHGHLVKSSGNTASLVVRNETVSTIFGHVHRIETVYHTQNTYMGARANLAHTPGCLCRIDGAVPSAKGSTGLYGEMIPNYENWQQGLTVVNYKDGEGSFNLENVYISTHDTNQPYRTVYNGKVYLPIEIEGLED